MCLALDYKKNQGHQKQRQGWRAWMFDGGTMFSKTELGSILKSTLHNYQNGKICKKKKKVH